jgi:3-hydroxymyristoyl/3-hydroxydecanoyl-(acyl carrier protein) dehydratase
MGIADKTIISTDNITEYIPQRQPIVMVDEFYGVDKNVSESGLTITADNFFCENGIFNECGVIEHIAQSAALRVGYVCKSTHTEVPVGYIGAVNKCKIIALPKAGDKLRTTIKIEQEIMDITLISATVKINSELIAECMMKIFLQK